MKLFFKKSLEAFKTLVTNKATKHQKWITFGSLAVALILNLVLGGMASLLLMLFLTFFAEFTYCFVPFKDVVWKKYTFKVPDYKGFRETPEKYFAQPQNEFVKDDLYFLPTSVCAFLVLKFLFLIF